MFTVNLVSVIGVRDWRILISPVRFLLENTDFLAIYTHNQVSNWIFTFTQVLDNASTNVSCDCRVMGLKKTSSHKVMHSIQSLTKSLFYFLTTCCSGWLPHCDWSYNVMIDQSLSPEPNQILTHLCGYHYMMEYVVSCGASALFLWRLINVRKLTPHNWNWLTWHKYLNTSQYCKYRDMTNLYHIKIYTGIIH